MELYMTESFGDGGSYKLIKLKIKLKIFSKLQYEIEHSSFTILLSIQAKNA